MKTLRTAVLAALAVPFLAAQAQQPRTATIAIYPFSTTSGASGSRAMGTPVQEIIALRAAAAFQKNERWEVLDRTSEGALKAEAEKWTRPENLGSAYKVNDGVAANAQYLLRGILESVESAPRTTNEGQQYHEVVLRFSVVISSVETGATVSPVKQFRVSSMDIPSGETMGADVTKTVVGGAIGALGGALGGRSKQRPAPKSNNAASGLVLTPTPESAMDRALANVADALAKWEAQVTPTILRKR